MPNYRYNATDATGKWVSGEVEASTHADAQARLAAQGLAIESMIEADDKPVFGRLSRTELVELAEQLAALTRSGVPLPSGLRAAANEMISARLRSTFRDLAAKIEAGNPLDQALASSGDRFPPDVRGLILAGSRSGRLTDLLSEFVRGVNLASELKRMFWSTLLYPVLTLLVIMLVVRFVCVVAVQAVNNALDDFGSSKPGSTQLLAELTRLMAEHGTSLLFAIVVGPILVWAWIHYTNTPERRRRILCGIPLIGPILRYCSLTEFCHRLAMLLEAELPLPLAFELAGSSVGDDEVASACQRMGRAVDEGESLSSAVRLWEAIPAGLGQLFQWSEDRRTLPEALHMAGDMFEARARSQSSFARSVLSTLILLMILWWIGFAVAALYLPMLSMISRLSG